MSDYNSAQITFSPRQSASILIVLVVYCGLLLLNNLLAFDPVKFLIFLLCLLLVVLLNIGMLHRLSPLLCRFQPETFFFRADIVAAVDDQLPYYTVLIPLREESAIVADTIRNVDRLLYPRHKLDVVLLVETGDRATRSALPRLPEAFRVVCVPDGSPRTKPRALNIGLASSRGELVTVFDAEDVPDPWQLLNAVAAFRDCEADVWAVQARLNLSNPTTNWLTQLFYQEYRYWHNVYLPYLVSRGYPVPLGGSSNHFRADKLRTLGGWDAFNVTEDADMLRNPLISVAQ